MSRAGRLVATSIWFAVPLTLAFLAGCVPVKPSSAPQVNVAEEERTANNPAALTRIGQAALSSNDDQTAATFLGRAHDLDPADPDAALGLADAETRENRVDDAVDVLRDTAARTDGASRARVELVLGRLLAASRRPAEAVAAFRQGLAAEPSSPRLLTGLGIALDLERDFAGADAAYGRALLIAPDDVAARNDFALSRALRGDTRSALTMLEQLRNEASDADRFTVDGNVAIVRAMTGDLSGAEDAASVAGDAGRNAVFYRALDRAAGGANVPSAAVAPSSP